MHNLGFTRSAHRPDHLLLTADTFVRAPLPGMTKATAIVHVSPAVGARFTQYTAELEPGGCLGPAAGQRFVYVIEGDLRVDGRALGPGGYVYCPEGADTPVMAADITRAAVIEKPYIQTAPAQSPRPLAGDESAVEAKPLGDDPDLLVRCLMPDDAAYDFAVNTMVYQPGA